MGRGSKSSDTSSSGLASRGYGGGVISSSSSTSTSGTVRTSEGTRVPRPSGDPSGEGYARQYSAYQQAGGDVSNVVTPTYKPPEQVVAEKQISSGLISGYGRASQRAMAEQGMTVTMMGSVRPSQPRTEEVTTRESIVTTLPGKEPTWYQKTYATIGAYVARPYETIQSAEQRIGSFFAKPFRRREEKEIEKITPYIEKGISSMQAKQERYLKDLEAIQRKLEKAPEKFEAIARVYPQYKFERQLKSKVSDVGEQYVIKYPALEKQAEVLQTGYVYRYNQLVKNLEKDISRRQGATLGEARTWLGKKFKTIIEEGQTKTFLGKKIKSVVLEPIEVGKQVGAGFVGAGVGMAFLPFKFGIAPFRTVKEEALGIWKLPGEFVKKPIVTTAQVGGSILFFKGTGIGLRRAFPKTRFEIKPLKEAKGETETFITGEKISQKTKLKGEYEMITYYGKKPLWKKIITKQATVSMKGKVKELGKFKVEKLVTLGKELPEYTLKKKGISIPLKLSSEETGIFESFIKYTKEKKIPYVTAVSYQLAGKSIRGAVRDYALPKYTVSSAGFAITRMIKQEMPMTAGSTYLLKKVPTQFSMGLWERTKTTARIPVVKPKLFGLFGEPIVRYVKTGKVSTYTTFITPEAYIKKRGIKVKTKKLNFFGEYGGKEITLAKGLRGRAITRPLITPIAAGSQLIEYYKSGRYKTPTGQIRLIPKQLKSFESFKKWHTEFKHRYHPTRREVLTHEVLHARYPKLSESKIYKLEKETVRQGYVLPSGIMKVPQFKTEVMTPLGKVTKPKWLTAYSKRMKARSISLSRGTLAETFKFEGLGEFKVYQDIGKSILKRAGPQQFKATKFKGFTTLQTLTSKDLLTVIHKGREVGLVKAYKYPPKGVSPLKAYKYPTVISQEVLEPISSQFIRPVAVNVLQPPTVISQLGVRVIPRFSVTTTVQRERQLVSPLLGQLSIPISRSEERQKAFVSPISISKLRVGEMEKLRTGTMGLQISGTRQAQEQLQETLTRGVQVTKQVGITITKIGITPKLKVPPPPTRLFPPTTPQPWFKHVGMSKLGKLPSVKYGYSPQFAAVVLGVKGRVPKPGKLGYSPFQFRPIPVSKGFKPFKTKKTKGVKSTW